MSVQHQNILKALREAGEDGVPVGEMPKAGGGWWRKRVDELNVQGYLISEDRGLCYLESEPVVERTASDQSSTGSGLVNPSGDDEAGLIPRASTDGSLSNEQGGVERASGMGGDDSSCVAGSLSPTQDTLFPASRPHFDDAREAA